MNLYENIIIKLIIDMIADQSTNLDHAKRIFPVQYRKAKIKAFL